MDKMLCLRRFQAAMRCGLAALALVGAHAGAQPLRLVTEEWPPFNYQEQGQARGLGVEMAQALLTEAGLAVPRVEFFPWNRAYAMALHEPQVLLFTVSRTAQREPLFHWIARIAPRELWLYRLASRNDIALTQLDQAKAYRLGVGPLEDSSTQGLVERGFVPGAQLDSVQSADPDATNLQKLLAGRFDLMVGNPLSVAYAMQKLHVPEDSVVPAYKWVMEGQGYWLALNSKSDPALVQTLQQAAKRLEQHGSLRALREQFLRPGPKPAGR